MPAENTTICFTEQILRKNKLERNFYNTLNDIREFESKLAPDVKTLFEKRNNGYQYDRIYTTNHEIPVEGDAVPEDLPPAEPHLLQSQTLRIILEMSKKVLGRRRLFEVQGFA